MSQLVEIVFLAYLRQLHQLDQAYTRHLLEDESLDENMVARFSDDVEKVAERAVEKLKPSERELERAMKVASTNGTGPAPERIPNKE